MSFPWDDITVARLLELRKHGLSASQISDTLTREFDCTCSRSGAIGKLKRLGLGLLAGDQRAVENKRRHEGKPKKPPAPSQRILPRRETPPPLRAEPLPEITEAVIPIAQRCTLLELDNNASNPKKCRWPIGDPQSPDFFFCGGKTREGRCYCGYHVGLAYQPGTLPRRDRRVA